MYHDLTRTTQPGYFGYSMTDISTPQFESPYFAAIDLGSNSFHMLIVRFNEEQIDIIDREKDMVQIARGLQKDGSLSREAKERALASLTRFAERLRDIPAGQIRAVGTKALRAARDTKQFLADAERALGVPIHIISGYEEARLVYAGFSHSVSNDHSRRLVIDIGGGSTEFIVGVDYEPALMESLGMGCVTFSENFFFANGVNAKSMRKAYLAACSRLESIRKIYIKSGWDTAHGTSGTIKAIADLVSDADGGAIITRQSLEKLYETLAYTGELPSADIPKLRQDVLPAGTAILRAVFDQLGLDQLHVANATLKEGLIYDTIGRFSDHDSRNHTVEKLQIQYQVDTYQAQRVATTALNLWRQIEGLPLRGISRTKILKWASMLHEVGLSISHTSFHHHGYYILRHSDLAGFGRYEQYILANLVRAHRRKLSVSRFDGMDESTLSAFLPVLLCLRLATLLHRRREDIDVSPVLTENNGRYTLSMPIEWNQEHPLTAASLEQERAYFSAVGISFELA